MKRRHLLAHVTAIGTAAIAGCTGDSGGGATTGGGTTTGGTTTGGMTTGGTTATTTAPQPDTTVTMKDTTFNPVVASVETGATVEWVNEDGYDHDVTAAQFHDAAASWSFSERLDAGGSTTYTFEESGVYEYYCTIHGRGTMCGAVLVGGASKPGPLPCESGATTTTTDGGGGTTTTTSDDGYY